MELDVGIAQIALLCRLSICSPSLTLTHIFAVYSEALLCELLFTCVYQKLLLLRK